jgi:hypothetical protein
LRTVSSRSALPATVGFFELLATISASPAEAETSIEHDSIEALRKMKRKERNELVDGKPQ